MFEGATEISHGEIKAYRKFERAELGVSTHDLFSSVEDAAF
jgi:hypothetical protein